MCTQILCTMLESHWKRATGQRALTCRDPTMTFPHHDIPTHLQFHFPLVHHLWKCYRTSSLWHTSSSNVAWILEYKIVLLCCFLTNILKSNCVEGFYITFIFLWFHFLLFIHLTVMHFVPLHCCSCFDFLCEMLFLEK